MTLGQEFWVFAGSGLFCLAMGILLGESLSYKQIRKLKRQIYQLTVYHNAAENQVSQHRF